MNAFRSVLLLATVLFAPATAGAALTCSITFACTSTITFEQFEFDADFPDALGSFRNPLHPSCSSPLAPQAFYSVGVVNETEDLRVGIVHFNGGSNAPTTLTTCVFLATEEPLASDFSFTTFAQNGSTTIDPPPVVEVTSIVCEENPAVCGDGVTDDEEECDSGTPFAPGLHCSDTCTAVPCGQPTKQYGGGPTAPDALFALRAAVGQISCDLQVCDTNGNGSVATSDALAILRKAVGQEVVLNCLAPA